MVVTLLTKEKILTIRLPKQYNGKYWFEDEDTKTRMLSVEADEENNRWIIKSTPTVTLYDNKNNETDVLSLRSNDVDIVRFGANEKNIAFIFVESDEKSGNCYFKYQLRREGELPVGRDENNCAVVIDNPYVSGVHAVLTFRNGSWKLSENADTNGIFVDGVRFSGSDALNMGSCIYIFGVKIILGNGFISINNPNNMVRVSDNFFKLIQMNNKIDDKKVEDEEEIYYYRSPRFIRKIVPVELKVDMPTQAEKTDETPIILTLAPSMIMGVASFATGIITLINTLNNNGNIVSALPTLIMSVSMLAGMIVFPFIMKKRDVKNKKKKEDIRRDKYIKYLRSLKEEVERGKRHQAEILNDNNPSVLDKTRQADFWKKGLWSKSQNDDDYLFIRLGLGNMPMAQQISYPEERFSLDDDEMRDALFDFRKKEKLLLNVPVGINLTESNCVGIKGANKNVINAVNQIVMQIGLLHGYDEVKIAFIGENKDYKRIDYIKNINHIWNNDKTERYLATNEDDTRAMSAGLNRLLQKRRDGDVSQEPYIVIIVASRNLAKFATVLDEINWETDEKIKVIYCYDDNGELPRDCDTIVNLDVNSALIYGKTIDNYNGINFIQDNLKVEECRKAINKSLKYRLRLKDGTNNLPKTYSFMEMFGVGKVEHLNILHRWAEHNPVYTLKTEVGIDPNGDRFYLDLHEKAHGPHGLVAGMTGSGKSEFIITYILSMAINYHPDEVAFVLIDYKGGGLAGAFDNDNYRLPHLAGTITNLDSGAIYRSILSINSELKHRQAIFNEVKSRFGEGTMDIYKYQKMYKSGQISEPMPHLFIISDEFAELKSQQPEFLDELISTARIGRSLGVHLILATQKPSGVVNDQIWANSKFKVCLKVQDRSDSMEMLKRPDAAELTDTGRFYLQVGYNELFLPGQSAWSGAGYPDAEEYVSEGAKDIEIVDNLGNVVEKIKFNNSADKDNGEQIVRIMEYLDEIAKSQNIKQRQLWLPEIPENIYLDELIAKYGMIDMDKLTAIAGELDDPYKQSQRLLTVDFGNKGNVICYGNSGSGMNIFVETTLYSLCTMYSPEEFNSYILDFENESLKMFKNVPHIGDVITDGDDERINNLYNMLQDEVKTRKELLSEFGGDINSYNKSAEKKLAKILIVISNYEHFVESYEKYEDINVTLCRDGVKYGIYFIITANGASSIRYRVAQNFNQHFVLKLNDATDYTAILGSVGGRTIDKQVGRGMIKDNEIYMFQSARITYEDNNVREYINNFADALKKKYGDIHAKRVPVMPENVTVDSLYREDLSLVNIPVGISYKSYNAVSLDLTKNSVSAVVAAGIKESAELAVELIKMINKVPDVKIKVLNTGNFDLLKGIDGTGVYADVNEGFEEIFNICIQRNNDYKKNNGIVDIDMSPMVVVLDSLNKLKTVLSPENSNNINSLLNAAEPFWNMYFIIVDDGKLFSMNSIQNWCQSKITKSCIWVGDGINSVLSYMGTKANSLMNNIPKGSGYFFKESSIAYLKLMMKAEDGDDNE